MTYQQPIAPPTNALALAGVIIGAAATVAMSTLMSHATPLALFVFAVPSLLAIIFGIVGLNTAKRLGGTRRTLAIWAIVLGFAPIPVWLIVGFLGAAIFGISR